ncbi:hypothetical protein [Halorussus sp. AFM4]|uniref:hypothetical protein n=1 Tax=Halorussus sp. AFM4 TaxID=3421651 RepID=UPI003EC05F07
MNKLRATAVAGGAVLLAAATWGALEYGAEAGLGPFAWVALLGVLVSVAPDGIAVAKNAFYRRRREFKGEDARAGTRDQYFASTDTFPKREEALDAVRDAVRNTDGYERVVPDDFPEGTGLSVTHAGFHNSFVRVNDSGRLVLAGASGRTADLAADLTDALGTSFDRSWANPMRQRKPVTGGLRVVLAVAILTAAGLGAGSVAAAGYPSDAYNPLEKVALASYDVRATVDPGISETEAAIAKARFRVTILQESSVEVEWTDNSSARLVGTGRVALVVAGDARSTLDDLRKRDLTAAQRTRVDRIATDLRDAEVAVATALEDRADDEGIGAGSDDIREVASALRSHRSGTGDLSLSIDLPKSEFELSLRRIDTDRVAGNNSTANGSAA